MRRIFILTSLAFVVLGSSCDKPALLNDQRLKVDADFERAKEEMRTVDAKFEALQTAASPDGMSLEQQHEKTVKKNAELEEKVEYLRQKCDEAEAALGEIRPRMATYKAKYLY